MKQVSILGERSFLSPGSMKLLLLMLTYPSAVILLPACQNQISSGVRAQEPLRASQLHWEHSPRVDTPPKLIRGAAPIYPITQLQQHKSGAAVISFTIDEQGKTRDFKVISTDYPYFASHAILAVQQWQFEPARKNGHPVAIRLRVPFNYRTPSAGEATPF
jgi:TonB family protein